MCVCGVGVGEWCGVLGQARGFDELDRDDLDVSVCSTDRDAEETDRSAGGVVSILSRGVPRVSLSY